MDIHQNMENLRTTRYSWGFFSFLFDFALFPDHFYHLLLIQLLKIYFMTLIDDIAWFTLFLNYLSLVILHLICNTLLKRRSMHDITDPRKKGTGPTSQTGIEGLTNRIQSKFRKAINWNVLNNFIIKFYLTLNLSTPKPNIQIFENFEKIIGTFHIDASRHISGR